MHSPVKPTIGLIGFLARASACKVFSESSPEARAQTWNGPPPPGEVTSIQARIKHVLTEEELTAFSEEFANRWNQLYIPVED